MQTRTFGNTGLEISTIGFGGAPIGLLQTEQEQTGRLLNDLLDAGLNFIDTAANYSGSEEAIGKAIGRRREEFVLVSKCGQQFDDLPGDEWSPTVILATVDRALRRLQADHLDVMLLHSCDLEILQRGEALGALVQARDAGKIRFAGYSGDNEAAAHAAALADVAVLETSVNICDQANIDQVLPAARDNNLGVIAKRPIANAAWKQRSDQPGFYADYADVYTRRLQQMKITPADLGFDGDPSEAWPEIALRFTLAQPAVHTAIVGTTSRQHLAANIRAAEKGPLEAGAVDKLRSAFREARQEAGETWEGQT